MPQNAPVQPATFTGHAIAAREVSYFYGDVPLTGTAYRFELAGKPGTVLVLLAGTDCPRTDGALYEVRLAREKYGFIQGTDPAFMTDLSVTECRVLSPS